MSQVIFGFILIAHQVHGLLEFDWMISQVILRLLLISSQFHGLSGFAWMISHDIHLLALFISNLACPCINSRIKESNAAEQAFSISYNKWKRSVKENTQMFQFLGGKCFPLPDSDQAPLQGNPCILRTMGGNNLGIYYAFLPVVWDIDISERSRKDPMKSRKVPWNIDISERVP